MNRTIGPVKQKKYHKIVIFFLPMSLNICFGCSKEPSHRDGPFEYPQHMFWLRNKKNNFQVHTLIWGPGIHLLILAEHSGSVGRELDWGLKSSSLRLTAGESHCVAFCCFLSGFTLSIMSFYNTPAKRGKG